MIIINILSVNSFDEMNCDSQQVDIFNHDQRLSYIWQQITKKFFFYMEILPAWLVINSSCPVQLPFPNPSLNVSAQSDLKKRLKNEQYQVIVRLLKRFQLISTECSQQRIFKKERPRSFIYISSPSPQRGRDSVIRIKMRLFFLLSWLRLIWALKLQVSVV